MVKLSDLLQVPILSSIKVINKNADLSKVVETIEISETPDIINYIALNSILITTAMAFKDNQNQLCDLIRQLNDKPVSALAIKLGRFINELDPKVIETADELNFPLLQIPSSTTLGVASHQLLSYIWDQETHKLHYALAIQRKFSKMLIEDASLNDLTKYLAHTLNRPIILIDDFAEIIHCEFQSYHQDEISFYKKNIIDSIKKNSNNISRSSENIISIANLHQQDINISITSIITRGLHPFLLVVLEIDDIPYPYSQLVIEQAANALGFIIFKNQKLIENNWKSFEDYFHLISKNKDNLTSKELLESGLSFNIINADSYQIVLVGLDCFSDYKNDVQIDLYYSTYRWLKNQISKTNYKMVIFPVYSRDKFAIIVQNNIKNIKVFLSELQANIHDYLPITISFSLGNEVFELSSLNFSYIEALSVLSQMYSENKTEFIKDYVTQGVLEILHFIPSEHTKHFCIHNLKELAYPTSDYSLELRKTLECYLDNQGEIKETAKMMFVHRNTVKYRIIKLNNILDYPIDDATYSLQLRLALILSDSSAQTKV